MLESYLIAALRNLLQNRGYTALTVSGLAIGLTAAILIALFVRDEYSYDRFLPDYDHIYRVSEEIQLPNRPPLSSSLTAAAIAAALEHEIPDVQIATRLTPTRVAIQHGAAQKMISVQWADPNFFRLFPFKVLSGQLARALDQPDSIVLTHAIARALFGRDDVTGETLKIDHEHTMRVTAVIEDLPSNTHLSVEALASGLAPYSRLATLDALSRKPDAIKTEDIYTYVKLSPGARLEQLTAAMRAFTDRNITGQINGTPVSRFVAFRLVPISAIHLGGSSVGEMKPPGDLRTLLVIVAIAILIVIVASSNFVSMMIARSGSRAIEVAVRKTTGATRSQLVVQFLGECFLYAALALAIALIAVELILPAFNTFLQRDIAFDYIRDPLLGATLLATAVVVGLAAGAYPALALSTFSPAAVLKGGHVLLPSSRSAWLRQSLIIFEFATLIALLVSTLTMHRQIQYVLNERLRLPTEQIYLIDDGCRPGFNDAVARLPGVRMATCASGPALAFERIGTSLATQDRGKAMFQMAPVESADFFSSFAVAPIAGRMFATDGIEDNVLRQNVASSSNPSIIINETGARALGYTPPSAAVGHFAIWSRIEVIDKVPRGFESQSSQIVGVVPDFSIGSVRNVIEPTVYYVDPSLTNNLVLTFEGNAIPQTLAAVRDLWTRQSDRMPPLEGRFLSEYVNSLYADVLRQSTLFCVFCGAAILLAAVGLLGLAVFTAERRSREIALRKVMGAGRWDILGFLGWEFARPVLWANLIAWPVAYLLMRRWLAGFAYHVDLSALLFVPASVLGLIIAAATVAWHAFRIARSRPAEAVRYE